MNDDSNGSEAQIRPYAVWCIRNMPMSGKIRSNEESPKYMNLFSYFLRNDKEMNDLYQIADKEVIPFIKTKIKEIGQ